MTRRARTSSGWRSGMSPTSGQGRCAAPSCGIICRSDPALRPAALLALLRVDLAQRWQALERVPVEWYRDRYPELDGEALVALIYEEYCLREEAGESPDAADLRRPVPRRRRLVPRGTRDPRPDPAGPGPGHGPARAGARRLRWRIRCRKSARRSRGSAWSRSWAGARSRGSSSPRSSSWPTGRSR